MSAKTGQRVELIEISKINILNPRERNKLGFQKIVDNIAQIGLKRPLTVSQKSRNGETLYDLVCGQGRLEAYEALGQTKVPALVVKAGIEDCLVASLVENCARRHHSARDLLRDIGAMRDRGDSPREISRKTGLSLDYVRGVGLLIQNGEQRLLRAVESGSIPISIALQIANAQDIDVQQALTDAYEKGLLKGKKLGAAKRLVEARRRLGKGLHIPANKGTSKLTAAALVKAFQQDTEHKKAIIRRSEITQNRLMFIAEGLRKLLEDDNFSSLLENEDLNSIPENIARRLAFQRERPS